MLSKLKSRKLWATVVGTALAAFGSQLGLPEPITTKIVALIATYIVGQSVVDAAQKPAP